MQVSLPGYFLLATILCCCAMGEWYLWVGVSSRETPPSHGWIHLAQWPLDLHPPPATRICHVGHRSATFHLRKDMLAFLLNVTPPATLTQPLLSELEVCSPRD